MANSAQLQSVQDKVRVEIAEQLGESFDNLAMAATAKADTIDRLSQTIADLTKTNAQLSNEVKELRKHLESALKQLKGTRAPNSPPRTRTTTRTGKRSGRRGATLTRTATLADTNYAKDTIVPLASSQIIQDTRKRPHAKTLWAVAK